MSFRSIPPIQCLVTFEALARLRSASRTADELCVTVSAVSHRMRQLEAHVGFKLFARSDFSLTVDGIAYLAHVRAGLAAFQRLPALDASRPVTRLRVAVTPTFARTYVMPRLETFRAAYPEVELTMQVSIPLLDVSVEESDLEVRYGTGHYTDREWSVINPDVITPACSPGYLAERGMFANFDTEAELAEARLVRSPLEPWSTWFGACGLALPEPQRGAQFNDLGLAWDAAASGFGVALVRVEMAASWFESGRLVRLSSRTVPSPHANYICWRPGTLERWECAAFVDWLIHRDRLPRREENSNPAPRKFKGAGAPRV